MTPPAACLLMCSLLAACGKADAPAPAGQAAPPTPGAPDDLCATLDRVIAAAPDAFRTLRTTTREPDGLGGWLATVSLPGARVATVADEAELPDWVSWYEDRRAYDAARARLITCPILRTFALTITDGGKRPLALADPQAAPSEATLTYSLTNPRTDGQTDVDFVGDDGTGDARIGVVYLK